MDLNGKYHRCGNEKLYNEQYDAYYCKTCDEWLEKECEDPNCEFCQNRPENPSIIDDCR